MYLDFAKEGEQFPTAHILHDDVKKVGVLKGTNGLDQEGMST